MKKGVWAGRRTAVSQQRDNALLEILRSVMTPFVMASLLAGNFTCPAFSQPPNSASRLSGNVSYNKISGPESGVTLLERIFNRVMSIPQIAMAKPALKSFPAEQQVQQKESAGVDYALAIRPKETGKIFSAPSPSIRVLPQKNDVVSKITASSETAAGAAAGDTGIPEPPAVYGQRMDRGMPLAGASSGTIGPSAEEAESTNVESWKGGNLMRLSGRAKDSNLVSRADAERLGIWDSLSSSDGATNSSTSSGSILPPSNMGKLVHQPGDNQYSQAAANSRARQTPPTPDLQSAVGRLYSAAKKMEEMQKLVDESAPAEKKAAATTVTASNKSKAKATFYNAPRQVQIVDQRPQIHDFRQAPDGYASYPFMSPRVPTAAKANSNSHYAPPPAPLTRRGASAGAGAGAGATFLADGSSAAPVHGTVSPQSKSRDYKLPSNAIPAQILSIEDATNSLRKQQAATSPSRANAIASQLYNQMMQDKSSNLERRETIALLPPNVATGIPLVSLGTSQMQVASALSNMGQLKEQKINRWTVMTWKKPDTGTTSLQLFFRNGLLDAIRIFDPTLVAPDFGVAPGDSLERVKEKFGEPAFLLQEPAQGLGQNYIYPISQVGFQLSRAPGNASPKVVSVLIFSVK